MHTGLVIFVFISHNIMAGDLAVSCDPEVERKTLFNLVHVDAERRKATAAFPFLAVFSF